MLEVKPAHLSQQWLLVVLATSLALAAALSLVFATDAAAKKKTPPPPPSPPIPVCNDTGTIGVYCVEKTASPNFVKVGKRITFTIRAFCTDPVGCANASPLGLPDTLPAGLKSISATASGEQPATCTKNGNRVVCAPEVYCNGTLCPGSTGEIDFVERIVATPTHCGTFTNTAHDVLAGGSSFTPASASFRVKCKARGHHHKGHHH